MRSTQLPNSAEQIRRKIVQYWTAILLGVGALVLWEVYANVINTRGDQYFPSLGYIVEQTLASSDVLLDGLQSTVTTILIAYALAMLFGVVLGIVFSEFYLVRQLYTPSLIFLYALPAAILAPLFILWFGSGVRGIAVFGAWLAFFPVFINTFTGMNQLEEEFNHLGDLYGASNWQMIRFIKFWKALPHITASAKIAVQYSTVGVIIAEFLAGGRGLGYLIILSTQQAQLGFVYGIIAFLIVFAVVFFMAVSLLIEYITPNVAST